MNIKIKATFYGECEADSMLEALKESRVLSIERVTGDTFEMTEGCDGVFYATVTKEQLLKLADEIKEIANSTAISSKEDAKEEECQP